jgi:uncharacterized membrane protein YeaQ/YmgE (transglycosylase-associated protein family)
MMGLLWAALIGLVVGALAKFLMPGKDPGGVIVTILLGIAGSFMALIVGRMFGLYGTYGQGPGLLASLLGAIALLAAYRWWAGRSNAAA